MIMPDARQAGARYEALRREAVQGTWGTEPGLAVLLRSGMVSWMLALSTYAPSPRANDAAHGAVFPLDSTREIVRLLAGMVLGQRSEVRA